MAESSRFARELNKYLDAAHITPAEAIAALKVEGFPVPDRTFSYWLQGYFLPRSEAAFQMVSTLEEKYGIPGNALSNALLHDLSSGKAFVPGEDLASEVVAMKPAKVAGDLDTLFQEVEETTDWQADVIRKVIRDEIRVSADYKTVIRKMTVMALIPSVPNPSMKVSWIYEEGDKPWGEDYLFDLQGATIGQQWLQEKDGTTTFSARLEIPDNALIPGQLHTISFSFGTTYSTPRNRLAGRIFSWELDFYSCAVFFEGVPPSSVEYVVLPPYENEATDPISVTPLEIRGNIVKMSSEHFGEVIGYIRYTP